MKPKIHGRCIQISADQITLINESGVARYPKPKTELKFKVGDILELSEHGIQILTAQQCANISLNFQERILHPRRLKAMRVRAQVEAFIRDFFRNKNFHEVRTPLMGHSAGMEAHIDPFQLKTGQYLASSPEFAMKKLLVGGLEKIFQICPAFRDEPFSKHHRPEFTMLEFYRAYSDYEAIMQDFENLVEKMVFQMNGSAFIEFEAQKISVQSPWPRLKVNDLFREFLQIDLAVESTVEKLAIRAKNLNVKCDNDSWDEIYFRLWLEFIEPRLPKDRAVFVTHYPASQAALANLTHDGWAKRFEAYMGGLELCNGFDELTDAVEQRRRFEEEIRLRKNLYNKENRLDESFLLALNEGMPPSGGVAVGLDRLVMLMADEPDIEFCFWLNPEANQAE